MSIKTRRIWLGTGKQKKKLSSVGNEIRFHCCLSLSTGYEGPCCLNVVGYVKFDVGSKYGTVHCRTLPLPLRLSGVI